MTDQRDIFVRMFTDARLKLQRANEHIAEVNRRISLVVSPDSQTIWIEVEPHTRVQSIHYRLKKFGELSDIALVIGDAIHNLKTVVDHSWFKTIEVLVPAHAKHESEFPICKSVDNVRDELSRAKLDILNPRLFELVVSEIKPYEGGDWFLWCLHRLDIVDKHHLLIPTASLIRIAGLKIEDQKGETHPVVSHSSQLGEEFDINIGPVLKIKDKGSAASKIIFKEGPAQTMEVCEMLRTLSVTVARVMRRLESLVEG